MGVIVWGAIIRGAIILGAIIRGAIVLGGQLAGGQLSRGAIVLEPIKHQIIFDLSNVLLKKYSRKLNETILVNNLGANIICSEHVTDNQSKYSK